jgi:tetratricopeptide (TPR) repeat protein
MATAMTPDEAMGRAAALFGSGNLAEARALCESILRADPRHFYALHLAAAIALKRGEPEECVRLATRALEMQPGHVDVLCNRGAALRRLNRGDAALADYDRALASAPNNAVAHNNRGVALAALNRHAEAIAAYERALELDPGYANARFHRALSRLVSGDFDRGWDDLEARWTGSETQGPARAFAEPQWTGRQELRDKTVLLYAEQGLGDTIQFCRYAALVRSRGAKVLLQVHDPLKELLAQLPGVERVAALGEPLPAFDYHCALLSLPRAFGTRLESIPADIPYLAAPEAHVQRWRTRLGARTRPRIGIAWSGSMTLLNDRNRTIALARLAPLRAVDATLVSLQKEVRDSDLAALESGAPILHFGAELADFRDTAALVSEMDLVISVDTAAAHLAGAMGKPVWLLLPFSPDWRWLLDRDTSPWYPGLRILRQPRVGDWDAVIERAAGELREFAQQLG